MERKFTDDEIVKALKMCNYNAYCDNCPCVGECWNVNKYAIDIINRQKAEIERLNKIRAELSKEIENFSDIGKMYSEIKAEAIKEFADRLKEKLHLNRMVIGYNGAFIEAVHIDSLVKEMTGENNGN